MEATNLNSNSKYNKAFAIAIILIVAWSVVSCFRKEEHKSHQQADVQQIDDMEYISNTNPPPFIIFIPGFKTKDVSSEDYLKHIKEILPDSEIEVQKWESDWGVLDWSIAVDRADLFTESIVEKIERMPENKHEDVVLIGHSLGGRIAIRALARISDTNMRIKRGIFLGAAIPDDDPDIEIALKATRLPCINISNREDYVLRNAYGVVGENNYDGNSKCALGAYGCLVKHPKAALLEHSIPITETEKKKSTVEKYENHKASYYLKELGHLLSSREYEEYANPISHIRKASIDRGNWEKLDDVHEWRIFQNSYTKQCKIVSPWENIILIDDYKKTHDYFTLIKDDMQKVDMYNSVTITIDTKDKPIKTFPLMIDPWKIEEEFGGWLLQHRRASSIFRIVDNRDFQRLNGSKEIVLKQFESIKQQLAQKDSDACKKSAEEGSK